MAAGYTPTAFAEAKSAPLPERGAEDGIQRREQQAVLESVSRCVGYIGEEDPGDLFRSRAPCQSFAR